jgi:hypothetical protein
MDPSGHNLGCGFTGVSGGGVQPEWIDELVDLTPFTGQEVLLRLEYVTDQSYSARGILMDDVRVPELGLVDLDQQESEWFSQGFVRTDNRVRQQFAVRLMRIPTPPERPEVIDLALNDGASGTLRVSGLDLPGTRAVLAISSLARATLEPAPYTVEVRAAAS